MNSAFFADSVWCSWWSVLNRNKHICLHTVHFSMQVCVSPVLQDWLVWGDTSGGSRLSGRTQSGAAEPRWRGWAGPEAGEASGCWLVWADDGAYKERQRHTKWVNEQGRFVLFQLFVLAAAGHTDLSIEPGFELIGIWVQGWFSHLTSGGEQTVKKLTFKRSVQNYYQQENT